MNASFLLSGGQGRFPVELRLPLMLFGLFAHPSNPAEATNDRSSAENRRTHSPCKGSLRSASRNGPEGSSRKASLPLVSRVAEMRDYPANFFACTRTPVENVASSRSLRVRRIRLSLPTQAMGSRRRESESTHGCSRARKEILCSVRTSQKAIRVSHGRIGGLSGVQNRIAGRLRVAEPAGGVAVRRAINSY